MDEKGQTYITADELLRRTKRSRNELAQLWQGLNESQMIKRPGPQDGWSVKDLIAHIVWWEEAMRDIVPKAIAGEAIDFSGTIDQTNATAFAEKRDQSLRDVLADFEASLERVESLLRGLSDEQLNDSAICQIFGKPLRHFIAANTYGHYDDHIDDMKAYGTRIRQ